MFYNLADLLLSVLSVLSREREVREGREVTSPLGLGQVSVSPANLPFLIRLKRGRDRTLETTYTSNTNPWPPSTLTSLYSDWLRDDMHICRNRCKSMRRGPADRSCVDIWFSCVISTTRLTRGGRIASPRDQLIYYTCREELAFVCRVESLVQTLWQHRRLVEQCDYTDVSTRRR